MQESRLEQPNVSRKWAWVVGPELGAGTEVCTLNSYLTPSLTAMEPQASCDPKSPQLPGVDNEGISGQKLQDSNTSPQDSTCA